MSALLRHRPLMSDGLSFRKHTQSQLPKHLTQSQLPQHLKKRSRTCKRDLRSEGVYTWFGGSLSHSIIQPNFFRKGLILFVSDRENSERFIVQSEFANCSAPQPAVRHESSRY